MLIPELVARVTILGKDDKIVAQLGTDIERVKAGKEIRNNEDQWRAGKFVHPHDACFDNEGNIFVAEWVATGRITKLVRVLTRISWRRAASAESVSPKCVSTNECC